MTAEPGNKTLDKMQILGNERGREWIIISEVKIKEQRGELGGMNRLHIICQFGWQESYMMGGR